MDLFLACLGALVAIPATVVAAITVQLFSRGPVFFIQEREGLGGKTIKVWKVRTMVPDAERQLHAYLENDPEAQAEWQRSFKLRKDPRLVPVVEKWIRRFSLDELPQLLNVMSGDMSLVSPRPFPPYHLKRFSPEALELRHRVRPGMTGLWQVLSRSDGNTADQEALDTHYVRNWSLWMDLYILGKTTTAVLGGRGAY